MTNQRICLDKDCSNPSKRFHTVKNIGTICDKHYQRYRKYKTTKLVCETIKPLNGEIWLPIRGYEDLYSVSNFGRVMSHGTRQPKRILKPSKSKKYQEVTLAKKDKIKGYTIHRLVLKTFKPVKNENELVVNHKDFNKFNNHLDNLEWMTSKENSRHAWLNGRHPVKKHCFTCTCEKFAIIIKSD